MLSDEEILKRIAEIEGLEILNGIPRKMQGQFFQPFNPLTNWSDLGPLIEKHIGNICFYGPEQSERFRDNYWVSTKDERGDAMNKSLPHAILLAIIEAHDERKS